MSILQEIKARFAKPLGQWSDDVAKLLEMIKPSQDDKFGDYQVNCAMPLKAVLNKPPREIAQDLIDSVDLSDLCDQVEIAGPGFINLTISESYLKSQLASVLNDDRLGVKPADPPLKFVIDYSSPNVAKPMHVGHIRSTVIGDALKKILRFAGHEVISDNHLGDWGTQFGMIIYGYKHFRDQAAFDSHPVSELGRLYKRVRKIMDYLDAKKKSPSVQASLDQQQQTLNELSEQGAPTDKSAAKKLKKDISAAKSKLKDTQELLEKQNKLIDEVEAASDLLEHCQTHPEIAQAVLEETAKLHAGDKENQQLWQQFLPFCLEDIDRIYQRLDIQFDQTLGESFYHELLPGVVESLDEKGLSKESEGAICVFMDEFDTPMIIQKKDGAFLYSTSDLATIKYRVETWNPNKILYVVDFRQHEHFEKFFAAAKRWGYDKTDFVHVKFGTVLGKDGKPYKTRAGDTVGLEGLLDEAVKRAHQVVSENDDQKPDGPELTAEERKSIADVVGIGALKYADLSQNRNSDYKFDYDKMIALKGNTATYLQYSFARVQGIFRRLNVDPVALREQPVEFEFAEPVEKALGLRLLNLGDAIAEVQVEFKPNLLANYLYETVELFFKFYAQCPVKDAASDRLKQSRLQLCELTARVIRTGLELLGIGVVRKM